MQEKYKKYIIAIDGLAATGKSSLARKIAEKLNITYIDTGAMYRAVALYFIQKNIEIIKENVLNELKNIKIDIDYDENGKMIVLLNNQNVTDEIRTNEVSNNASIVAQIQEVRDYLISEQRKIGSKKSVVMDGRDIGNVVFPNANMKLYVVTDIDVKAQRRLKDYREKGIDIDFETVKQEIINRDKRDEKNAIKAEDAIVFDTTNYTVEEAVNEAIKIIKEKLQI